MGAKGMLYTHNNDNELYDHEIIMQIIDDINDGCTIDDISYAYNLPKYKISRINREHNPNYKKNTKLTETGIRINKLIPDIVKMLYHGYTYKYIAYTYDINQATVLRIKKQYTDIPIKTYKKLSKSESKENIIRLVKLGYSLNHISKMLHVSYPTIYKTIEKKLKEIKGKMIKVYDKEIAWKNPATGVWENAGRIVINKAGTTINDSMYIYRKYFDGELTLEMVFDEYGYNDLMMLFNLAPIKGDYYPYRKELSLYSIWYVDEDDYYRYNEKKPMKLIIECPVGDEKNIMYFWYIADDQDYENDGNPMYPESIELPCRFV